MKRPNRNDIKVTDVTATPSKTGATKQPAIVVAPFMHAIYKYQLNLSAQITDLTVPLDATVLNIQLQNEVPTLWLMVDTAAPKTKRRFCWQFTGKPFEGGRSMYIATLQHSNGLVYHFFEVELK